MRIDQEEGKETIGHLPWCFFFIDFVYFRKHQLTAPTIQEENNYEMLQLKLQMAQPSSFA